MQAWLSKTFIAFDIFLYMASRTWPIVVGSGENFRQKGYQIAGKRYFEIGLF